MCFLYAALAPGARSWNQLTRPLIMPVAGSFGACLVSFFVAMSGGSLRIDADHDAVVVREIVRRHGEVLRRRNALEHAARHVETRLVAGAEITALPLGVERLRADLGLHLGR